MPCNFCSGWLVSLVRQRSVRGEEIQRPVEIVRTVPAQTLPDPSTFLEDIVVGSGAHNSGGVGLPVHTPAPIDLCAVVAASNNLESANGVKPLIQWEHAMVVVIGLFHAIKTVERCDLAKVVGTECHFGPVQRDVLLCIFEGTVVVDVPLMEVELLENDETIDWLQIGLDGDCAVSE